MEIGTREHFRHFDLQNGYLRASAGGVTLTGAGADWGDQVVEVTVRQIQVGASVMFRARDGQNGYVWTVGGPLGSEGGLGQLRMSKVVDGRSTLLGTVVPLTPAPGNTYRLRVEAVGDRIRTFVDGVLVDDRVDATFPQGRVGTYLGGADVGEYDDLTVRTPGGDLLLEEDFSGDLSAWDVPPTRQDVPLVVFSKPMPAGRVVLGPISADGTEDSPAVTFVVE